MPDYSILMRHAVQNVWCNPEQDKQRIYKTARVTPSYGSRSNFRVMLETHTVPVRGSKYHVFQIDFIPESSVNLDLNYEWVKVSSLCNNKNMIIDIYLEEGLMLPRSECWIKNTFNGALIIAVRQERLIELNNADDVEDDILRTSSVYVRLYTSKYTHSTASESGDRRVHVYGKKVVSSTDITSFAEQLAVNTAFVGITYGYINGRFVSNFSAADIQIGQYVEMVQDSALLEKGYIDISDIPVFTSNVISNNRYFVVLPGDIQEIVYYDDVDFYLTDPVTGRGLYINRNREDNIRMMGHCGFSISSDLLNAIASGTIPELGNVGSLRITYCIRESGFSRGMISNRNRLNKFISLMKTEVRLPELAYENDLPVTEWKYPNIETADINRLYGVYYDNLTPELIRDAYGYHTLAKQLAPHTQKVIIDELDSSRSVDISALQTYGCSIFEYDDTNTLLGVYHHSGEDTYVPNNIATTWVSIYTGFNTLGEGIASEANTVAIDTNFEFRAYAKEGSVFVDKTDSLNTYTLVGNTFTWDASQLPKERVVITDKNFFMKEVLFVPGDTVFVVDIGYITENGFKAFDIPAAQVDAWANNKPLVEGLDYFVVWPKVVITNKSYINDIEQQNLIRVMARGHSPSDLSYKHPVDYGFIKWGLLSRNTRYDVHWDQSFKAIVKGSVYEPESILYDDLETGNQVYFPSPGVFESEFSVDEIRSVSGGEVLVLGYDQNNALNGYPYLMKDVYTGLTAVCPGSTRDIREEMLDFDRRLSIYLTEKLKEITPSAPNTIVQKYPIVSAFMNAAIMGILDETISEVVWDKYHYDETEVRAETEHFSYLLAADVTQDHLWYDLDKDIADIVAHPYYERIPVNLNQYRFLEFIAHTILFDRVDVSRFLIIGALPEEEPEEPPPPPPVDVISFGPEWRGVNPFSNDLTVLGRNIQAEVYVLDNDNIVAVSTVHSKIGISRDHGQSWEQIDPSVSVTRINGSGGYVYPFGYPYMQSGAANVKMLLGGHDDGISTELYLFLSTDNCETWTNISSNLPAGIHYTEYQNQLEYGNGVWILRNRTQGLNYRSTNNGTTWTAIPVSNFGLPGASAYTIIQYVKDDVWIAFDQNAGYASRTTDGGLTWTALPRWLNSTSTSGIVTQFYTDKNGTLMAAYDGNCVRSSDSGATWARIATSALLFLDRPPVSLGNNVWVAFGSYPFVMYISYDNGITWVDTDTVLGGGITGQEVYQDGSNIYIATITTLYRSTDNAVTWTPIATGLPAQAGLIVVPGKYIFVSGYISTDEGVTWQAQPNRYNAVLSPSGLGTYAYVSPVVKRLSDDSLFTFSSPNSYYAVSVASIYPNIVPAPAPGSLWGPVPKGLLSLPKGTVSKLVRLDGTGLELTSTLWETTIRVEKIDIDPDLETGATINTAHVINDAIFITATSTTIEPNVKRSYVSHDDGETWTRGLNGLGGVDNASLVTLIVGNTGVCYAKTNSGYLQDLWYRTTDSGSTWINVTPGLVTLFGNKGVSAIQTDKSGIWIAGSVEGGIAKSTDDGLTWVSKGNPAVGGYLNHTAGLETNYSGTWRTGWIVSFDHGETWVVRTIGDPAFTPSYDDGTVWPDTTGVNFNSQFPNFIPVTKTTDGNGRYVYTNAIGYSVTSPPRYVYVNEYD